MAVTLLPNGMQVFLDGNGVPVAGGEVYFYIPSTETFKNTWSDSAQTILNLNPVPLDGSGRAVIWGDGSYRQILKDSAGDTIWDVETTSSASSAALTTEIADRIAADAALQVEIDATDTALAAETAARIAADTALVQKAGDTMTGSLIVAQTAMNTAVSPTANPTSGSLLATYTGLAVQTSTTHPSNREWAGIFGIYSTLGAGVANNNGDKVALYAGALAGGGSGDLWSLNTVIELAAGSGNYNAQGYELDLNNLNVDRGTTPGPSGFTAPVATALSISGASTMRSTAGALITGVGSTQWERGWCAFGGIVQAAFVDYSSATTGFEMQGTHSGYGIDMLGSVLGGAMRIPNNDAIVARNAANSADITLAQLNASDIVLLGISAAGVYCSTILAPTVDNSVSNGDGTHRWTAVWAVNGTIQTSDTRLKTDISPLPSVRGVFAKINPVHFKWKSGGIEYVDSWEEQDVQVTKNVVEETWQVEMRDGKAVQIPARKARNYPVWDEVPLLDVNGQQVFVEQAARPEIRDSQGRIVVPARPAFRKAEVHRVPRMEKRAVRVQKPVDRAGRRTHWGFLAPDVKAGMDTLGLDFGGYVKDEHGVEHLRPDQLIPVLWKAVQELIAELDELKAKLGKKV